MPLKWRWEAPDDSQSCDGHRLASVLPSAAIIGGMQRGEPRCDWISATVTYARGRESCQLTLTDMKAPIPDFLQKPEMLPLAQLSLSQANANHRAPIERMGSFREMMLESEPWQLEMTGGVDHLPVVGRLQDGGRYAIGVPEAGSYDDGSLTAIAGDDRHGFTIACTSKVTDAPSASALFEPWIPHFHVGAMR